MSKRKSKKLATVGIVVLILLIVGALVSLVLHKSNVVGFDLICNNQTLSPEHAFYVDQGDVYIVNISVNSYDVKVVPNYNNDIVSFNVENITRTLKDVPDLTKYFITEKNEHSFVICLSKTLFDILSEIYTGYKVENVSSFCDYGTPILNLVVISQDGSEITIPLLVDNVNLTLNNSHIAF